MLEVHINWLKITSPPVQHVPEHDSNEPAIFMQSNRVPWIRTMVIISKVSHPLKGYRGMVKNVLFEQETSSGLRVAVQLTHLDPSSPFKTEVFDYDDIVEASYGTSLLLLCLPLTTLNLIVLDANYSTSRTQRANNLNLETTRLNHPDNCWRQALVTPVTLHPCRTGCLHPHPPGIRCLALHWPSALMIPLPLPLRPPQ